MKRIHFSLSAHRGPVLAGLCAFLLLGWWVRHNRPERLLETLPGQMLALENGQLLANQGARDHLDLVSVDVATGAKRSLWREPDPLVTFATFDAANDQIIQDGPNLYYVVTRAPQQVAPNRNEPFTTQTPPLVLRRFDRRTNKAEDVLPLACASVYVDPEDASVKMRAPRLRILHNTVYWVTLFPDAAAAPHVVKIPRSGMKADLHSNYCLARKALDGGTTQIIATGLTSGYNDFFVQNGEGSDRVYWTTGQPDSRRSVVSMKLWAKTLPGGVAQLLAPDLHGPYAPMLRGTPLGLYVFEYAHTPPSPLKGYYFGVSEQGVPVSSTLTVSNPSLPGAPSTPHFLQTAMEAPAIFGKRVYVVQHHPDEELNWRTSSLVSMNPDGSDRKELPVPHRGIVADVRAVSTYEGHLYFTASLKPVEDAPADECVLLRLVTAPMEHLEEVCKSPSGLLRLDSGYGYYFEVPKQTSGLPGSDEAAPTVPKTLWTDVRTLYRFRL